MGKNFINPDISIPTDYEDKNILLSDGSEVIGYLDVKSGHWCKGIPVPLLGEGDERKVVGWNHRGGHDSFKKLQEEYFENQG